MYLQGPHSLRPCSSSTIFYFYNSIVFISSKSWRSLTTFSKERTENYSKYHHLLWTSFFDIWSINSSEEVNLILHFWHQYPVRSSHSKALYLAKVSESIFSFSATCFLFLVCRGRPVLLLVLWAWPLQSQLDLHFTVFEASARVWSWWWLQ